MAWCATVFNDSNRLVVFIIGRRVNALIVAICWNCVRLSCCSMSLGYCCRPFAGNDVLLAVAINHRLSLTARISKEAKCKLLVSAGSMLMALTSEFELPSFVTKVTWF